LFFQVSNASVETLVPIEVNQVFALNGGAAKHFGDATGADSLLNICYLHQKLPYARDAYTCQPDIDIQELSKPYHNVDKEKDENLGDFFYVGFPSQINFSNKFTTAAGTLRAK